MKSSQRQLVNKYIELFYRRKFYIVLLFLLSLPVGLYIYTQSPKIYEASSLLSYQQQKITNRLSPDNSSRIRDIVSTLSQIITSRTHLEKLIVDLDLYPKQREELPIEDVIEILRSKIQIKPSRGDIFTISYSGSEPDKVAKVTNLLASKFIEENLKYRQERATETSSYTSAELQMAKKVMDKKENSMRDYKLKYYNEMPEQRGVNMSALTSLQVQYQGKQDSIQDLSRTLVLIQDQLSARKEIVKNMQETPLDFDFDFADIDEQEDGLFVQDGQLENVKATLDLLLMRYTEKHPDVRRLRKVILNKEKDIDKERDTSDPLKESVGMPLPLNESFGMGQIASPQVDQTIMNLEVQHKNIELNIATIQQEKEELKAKIEQYEQWISKAPVREAEWSSLTREYNQHKRHYDYLVAQDLSAESMLNLERQQKGSHFRIEDPARSPRKPISPNFLLIIGMSAVVSLGLGAGLTLAFDLLDSSCRDPESLESVLGVPLLISIPYIVTDEEKKKHKKKRTLKATLLILVAIVVAAMFVAAWMRGNIVI